MTGSIQKELARLSNAQDAAFLQRYFKTLPGQYGEGDRFRGIRVPVLRRLAGTHREIPLERAERLLRSPWHEDRLLALLLLVGRYGREDEAGREDVYGLYLRNTHRVNNWDLVDLSAPHIVGAHLSRRPRSPLDLLARSGSLWERRIAILATLHFIRRGDFHWTLRIARKLLDDREELIHKAVGWMLREVGKRDAAALEAFLDAHAARMPRTTLRYAIERLPEPKRLGYLKPRSFPALRLSPQRG